MLLFGCNPQYIVIVFLDFLSKSFSSLAFHWIILAPYLNIATAHVFIAVTLFPPFNLDFEINLCLRFYSLVIFTFISVSLILSNSSIPNPNYTFSLFTSLHCKNPTFLYPKLHAVVGAKHIHSSHKRICLFFTLSIQF